MSRKANFDFGEKGQARQIRPTLFLHGRMAQETDAYNIMT